LVKTFERELEAKVQHSSQSCQL